MVSKIRTGGIVINYSGRFSISRGLSFKIIPSSSSTAMKLERPERELHLPRLPEALPHTDELQRRQAGESFTVLFSLQFGPTIYAPMQSCPPTKITKQTPTPQYPPSKVAIATTPLPPNKSIQTTVTKAITWSFSQMENPVSVTLLFPLIRHGLTFIAFWTDEGVRSD
jgi:hypothetical protein